MVTETDRNKARSAVVSAYNALDCVTIPFSFLHAFADAAVDAVSTDAEPVAWRGVGSDGVSEVTEREDIAVQWREDGIEVTPLYAGPVKTAPAVAVKALEWFKSSSDLYISDGGIKTYSLHRENGYWWVFRPGDHEDMPLKMRLTAPTLEKAKAAAQADYEARIRSALSAQVQDVAGLEGWQLVPTEPTHSMIRAMSESKATDDEGEYPCLSEIIDFSGENKTHTALKAAYRAMLAASPASKHGDAE